MSFQIRSASRAKVSLSASRGVISPLACDNKNDATSATVKNRMILNNLCFMFLVVVVVLVVVVLVVVVVASAATSSPRVGPQETRPEG